ncbi:uncharacterized protein LOC124413158 [Diprion similis]|uniref:uncharacterized protein LOC124413158 n=1 Tax=Diprion similis TaxID=362088 RepID=UPI001EF96C85|nr:uncharacterized protein LOC124413158 [Diprion similis]
MSAQTDFWDQFWLARFFLRFVGILPIGGSSALWKSRLTEFLATLPLWAGFSTILPEFQYIFFHHPSVDNILESLLIVSATLTGQLRSLFVIAYRSRIARLYSICESMWDHSNSADRKIILTWITRAKFISMMYFFGANCLVAVFIMTTTIQQRASPKNSTTKYYPFTPQEDSTPSPEYEIKYAVQVICCFCSMSYIAACDMTGTILSFNMCGQLAAIRSWLEELSKGKLDAAGKRTDGSLQEGLKKCIHRHQVVLDLCAELEDVNQYNCLIQLVTEMYIMAISAAQLTKLQNFGSLRHLITFLLAINGLF